MRLGVGTCVLGVTLVIAITPAGAEDQAVSHYRVVGESMQPTLAPGDKIWVLRDFYRAHPVVRGDLVALQLAGRKTPSVKRAVAVAGDRATVRERSLLVGEQIYPLPRRAGALLAKQLQAYDGVIPKRQLLALGDNPTSSFDSAHFGFIATDQLLGKVLLQRPADRQPSGCATQF